MPTLMDKQVWVTPKLIITIEIRVRVEIINEKINV